MQRQPSHPPSDPRPLQASGYALGGDDRPGRLQLVAALLLGVGLVASGLYLWRRPHTSSDGTSGPEEAASGVPAGAILTPDGGLVGAVAMPDAGVGADVPVALSDARVLGCQDRGSKKTPPDACDRLGAVEQALASAITQSAPCAPAAGGTIEYLADVSFARHKLSVSLPRAGRSVRDRKALKACAAAVRGSLSGLALDGIEHQHSRYKIAVTATYRASTTGG